MDKHGREKAPGKKKRRRQKADIQAGERSIVYLKRGEKGHQTPPRTVKKVNRSTHCRGKKKKKKKRVLKKKNREG